MSRHPYSDTPAVQRCEWEQPASPCDDQPPRNPYTLVFHVLVPGIVVLIFCAIGVLSKVDPLLSIAQNAVYSIAGMEPQDLPQRLDTATAAIAPRPEILALRREGVVENIAGRFDAKRRLWL